MSAVHALRLLPANLSDLRPDRPRTFQPTRPGRPGPGRRRRQARIHRSDQRRGFLLPRLSRLHHRLPLRRACRRSHGGLSQPGPPVLPADGAVAKFREFVLQKMLPSPDLLETSMLPARLYQKLGIQWLVRHSHILKLGPEWMDKAEGMMPELHPPLRPQLPEVDSGRRRTTWPGGIFPRLHHDPDVP